MKQLSRSDSHALVTKLGRVASTLGATWLLRILLLGLSMTVPVAHAQKPGGGGTLVLPNARYTLTWLGGAYGNGQPRDINNSGILVGSQFGTSFSYPFGGTAFYAVGGVTYDLNGLSAVWRDLDLIE